MEQSEMRKIMLNGEWEVCFEDQKLKVQVPGVLEKYLEKKDICTSFHYHKEFELEKDTHKYYILGMDGISCAAKVILNGQEIKKVEGIWTPHHMDINDVLKHGKNHLEIIVEKPSFDKADPYYYRSVLFGFIPDVLYPFSGIYKDIYIMEKAPLHFEELQLNFDYDNEMLVVKSRVNLADCVIKIQIGQDPIMVFPYTSELYIPLHDIHVWSLKDPFLYEIGVSLWKEDVCYETQRKTLGFRTIKKCGDKILLNGEPAYFRGILHWGYYPEHHQVIPDIQTVKKELLAIREQGFNAVKFCLFLPPQYYYDLCDELGILVWQELPLWLPYDNGYLFPRIAKQYPQMMNSIAHHPSLFMISIGCELDATIPKETLDGLYEQITKTNTQAIVCDNSGSGECYEGALHSESDIYDYHFYGEIHHMQQLIHEFKHASRKPKPWFFGEFNDMDTFRDLRFVKSKSDEELYWASPDPSVNLLRYVHANAVSDMPIYHYEKIVKENDIEKDMEQLIVCANQKAYDVRKYNLETTRRNDVMGYSITAIRDVPITSCGIFDDFNQKKWSDASMTAINGDVVISMAAPLKRKWHHGADVFETLDEYNFYEDSKLTNRIFVSNHTAQSGKGCLSISLIGAEYSYQKEEIIQLSAYQSQEVASLDILLPKVKHALRMSLVMKLEYDAELISSNHWDIWVYPKQDVQVQLFDPTNCLDGIDDVMQVKRIHELDEINLPVLVTTVLTNAMLTQLPKRCSIVYLQSGEGYFPIQREPFWRECVRLISPNSFLDSLAGKGYDSLQFVSLESDVNIAPCDILKKTTDYERIMSRIDNRRFHRSECIFRFKQCQHSILVCTLNFQKSSGTQARSFAENIVAQNLLKAMVQEQEKQI